VSSFFQWIIDLVQGLKFWFLVEPWEKAVLVRGGKKTKVVGPGFHWKIPEFDFVYIVNTRLRLAPTTTQIISTKDGKVVTLGVSLGFSISDPLLSLSTYLHPENSLTVLVHNHVADYVAGKETEEISISDLEDSVMVGLKDSDPDNGMTVEFVKVTSFIISSTARTIRLIQDDIVTDLSSPPADRPGKPDSAAAIW